MAHGLENIWKKPGAEARLAQLWTVEKQTADTIASLLFREFQARVSARGVSKKAARMGLNGYSRLGEAAAQIERITTVTLPAGYAYANGRLLSPEARPS